MVIKTVYLKTIFEPAIFQATVKKTIEHARLLQKEVEFDTIAFSGVSGAGMGFILGHALNLPVLVMRRDGDGSHYRQYRATPLEGNFGVRRYLVVDDFIASGDTVNRLIKTINAECPLADCAAILTYADSDDVGRTHTHPQTGMGIRVINTRPKEATL